MKKTTEYDLDISDRITLNKKNLAAYLDCGTATADKIGELAGAKITIGKRVLYYIPKIQRYIEALSL